MTATTHDLRAPATVVLRPRVEDETALPYEWEPTAAVKRRLVLVALRERITRHAVDHGGGELHPSCYFSCMQTPKWKEPLCW